MPSERKRIETLFESLCAAPLRAFPAGPHPIDAPEEQGVYVIYDRDRQVVHVGRTVRGKRGLIQRLRNHVRGQSSFVRTYLQGDGRRLGRDGYHFRYLVVSDERERALLEALAIGRLCPKHLGLGKK